ncbi:hypothetical protein ACFLUH_02645 [Chloroflexota bacterium]
MDTKIIANIVSIRKDLGIPEEGFKNEANALDWYKTHYHKAKEIPFEGSFGYHFGVTGNIIEFDFNYDDRNKNISINFIPPIDKQVPLDNHAISLARGAGIDVVSAPALRLVILIGPPIEELPNIPSYLAANIGNTRLFMHLPSVVSEEMRNRILDEAGNYSTGISQGYLGDRQRKNLPLYFDVLKAYSDWVEMKREKEREGIKVSSRGYLKWIAKRLVSKYDWDNPPSSYTVCRYLERAKKIWNTYITD